MQPPQEQRRHIDKNGRLTAGLCVLALVAPAAGLASCGSDAKSPAVVHVGALTISKATVERWSHALARGTAIVGLQTEAPGAPRQRALSSLLAADWLRAEAQTQGVTPSVGAVDRALEDRRAANGADEFEQSLRASGQTVDDVKLEVEAELARAAIRRKVLAASPAVTEQEVVSYYNGNRQRFTDPETRIAELVENLPSPAVATALVKRIGIGPSFTKKALHERLQPEPGVHQEPDIERVKRAIFAAQPHVPSRPMSLNGHWTVFVVRKITPASLKPLAKVRATILPQLAASHRKATLAAFTKAYRKRLTAKTDCRPGYVVQGCSQYAGPVRSEPDPLAGE